MKPSIRLMTRLLAVATMGVSLCAINTTAFAHSDDEHAGMGHRHHMMHDRPFLMAVHQLNLTDEQRQQIKDIVKRSEDQEKADWSQHKGELKELMNPGDPNYAGAVKAAEDAAVAHIEKRSQDNLAIYNLLTAEQKAKLPQVIEQMRQRMQEHHTERHQHDSSSSSK
jgi:Spy/CpxP family protein refolding chaperone